MSCLCIRRAAVLLPCIVGALSSAGAQYQSNPELAKELKELASTHAKIVHLSSIAKSRADHDVWLIELGAGDKEKRQQHPAMLVVAGIEGNDLAGTFSAVKWAERLAAGYATDEKIDRKSVV